MAEPRPPDRDELPARLARLSAALQVEPPAPDLAADVQERIATMSIPRRRPGPWSSTAELGDRLRRHWRAATAVGVALLIGVLAVSPAGARIAEWLGIGAVQVEQDQPPSTGTPDPADADGFTEATLDEVAARVTFAVRVPAELGPPDRVFIGPGDAVVSMVWVDGDPAAPDGPVRLDQLAGQPDFAVIKKYAEDIEFTQVDGADAFWLRAPHPLDYVDPAGSEHTERSRIAGPTLIWLDGPVTLRLEGVGTSARAQQIARSLG